MKQGEKVPQDMTHVDFTGSQEVFPFRATSSGASWRSHFVKASSMKWEGHPIRFL